MRARELLDAAAKAQEREDYESAAGKLRELVKLSPRSQKDKELLAKMERAHKETIARRQKITSLLDEASFALKAENPEDAISKLRNLLDNLDPNNTRAKVLLAKAHNLLTRKIITARLEMFDSYFAQGKASELAEVIDPEQSNLRSQVAREMRDFCKENIRIVSAGHTGLNIMLDRDSASVDAVFKYEIELAEAKRTLSGSLKRRIKLVRRADTWYIAAVENLD